MKKTTEDRFWSKVYKSANPDDCWIWLAGKSWNGYGTFWNGSKNVYAHRYSYELVNGKIADNMQLDHLCRNRACIREDHLEQVTCKENLHRSPLTLPSISSAKIYCSSGHEFSKENTYTDPKGFRYCLTCRRLRDRRRYYNPDSHRRFGRDHS